MPGPDSTNRHKYIAFTLEDTSIVSSRDVYFNDIDVDRIIKIEVFLKTNTFVLDKATLPGTFLEFIHFRSAGTTEVNFGTGRGRERVPINTWTVGWRSINGAEHLDEFDFKSGRHIQRQVRPSNSKFKTSHWHPKSLVRPGRPTGFGRVPGRSDRGGSE